MKRYIQVVIIGILILFSVADVFADGEAAKETIPEKNLASQGTAWDKLSVSELEKYTQCDSDQDCVIANNGCCDCANGGENVAINRNMLQAFKSKFKCDNVVCTEKAAIPPCGSGLVSCVGHRCKYFSSDKLSSVDGDLIEGLRLFRNNGGDVYPVKRVERRN